jgi:hypothetical protein
MFKLGFLNTPVAVRLLVGSPAPAGGNGQIGRADKGKRSAEPGDWATGNSTRSQLLLAMAGALLVLALAISIVASALVEAVASIWAWHLWAMVWMMDGGLPDGGSRGHV